MIIRDFRKEDIEAVIECAAESFKDEFEVEGFDPNLWRKMVQRRFSIFGRMLFGIFRLFDKEPIKMFIADVDGKAVGTTMVTRRGNIGYIHAVMVNPNFRRKGIATELMRAAIKDIQNRRMARAILQVLSANDAAKSLYQKLGFQKFDATIHLTANLDSLPNLEKVEGVQVRELQESDINAVYNLIRSLNDPSWLRIYDFKMNDLKTPVWSRIFRMGIVKDFVAVKDEKIVGYASLSCTTAKMACQITRLDVSPNEDAMGIEEELIKACVSYVKPLGTKRILVKVQLTRESLIEKLTALGFKKQFVAEGMVLEIGETTS